MVEKFKTIIVKSAMGRKRGAKKTHEEEWASHGGVEKSHNSSPREELSASHGGEV